MATLSYYVYLLLIILAIGSKNTIKKHGTKGTPRKDLHSSCFDLEDGTHYLQILTSNELSLLTQSEENYLTAPIVRVRCHKGYTIIDPSFDDNWIEYFTSFHEWKLNKAGPDLEDHFSWNQWFLPSLKYFDNTNNKIDDIDITYTISPNCRQCIGATDPAYNDKVYYMSGDIFSCYWPLNDNIITNNQNQCSMEDNDYSECRKCHNKINDKVYYSANCGSMIYDTNTPIFKDHQRCMEDQQANKLPSIGINGEYCVCYKPSKSTEIKSANWGDHYAMDSWDEDNDAIFDIDKEKELRQEENIIKDKVNIKLYQKDFEDGTYRISQPGTYTLFEHIKFNFNAGGIKHPNSLYSWMPREDQEDQYPGSSQNNHDDFYSMGFFAGITVETDDVVIDLNGYEIAMDDKFYIQQRFFVCISLTNKLLNDNKGPIFMGIGQKSASNVIIKNGVIGLTSHMAIFGSNSHNVHLINLIVRDFETHGIVLDKFEGFTIKNVEIGPSIGINKELKINKRYTNARLMLPIFYSVLKENPDTEISFYKRGPYKMQDIIDRLLDRMDLAFDYAINGMDNIDIESDLWKETRQLFINQDGVSTHSSIYGLLLRPKDDDNIDSNHIIIDNLYIHDLIINHKQIIKLGVSPDIWLRNSFNAPIDLNYAIRKRKITEEWQHDQDYYQEGILPNIQDSIYYGDVYTDTLIAMRQISNSWWSLARTVIWPQIIEWTQTGKKLKEYMNINQQYQDDQPLEIKQICGYDMISGESKGVIGINIAYSRDIHMTNIQIDNLINMGEFGNTNCDYYGHDYQGNHAKAINIYKGKNINIEQLDISNIVSFTGPSFGIYVDTDYNANINYAKFTHIDSGVLAKYNHIDMSKDNGINKAAMSCSIYCSQDCQDIEYYDIEQECINGHIECNNEYNQMLIHHQCQIDAEYETPIGIINVKSNGEIKAHLFKSPSDPGYTSIIFKGWYFGVGIVVILAILAGIKYIYFRHNKETKEQRRNDDLRSNEIIQDEDQPLIRNRDTNHQYNTL